MNNLINDIKQIVRSKLIKSSGIYTVSYFIRSIIPFLLLPILTKVLNPKDYGIITMFVTLQTFFYPFVGFNLEGAVARVYYSKEKDINQYISNVLIITNITTIIIMVLTYFTKNILSTYTSIPSNWILLIPILCLANIFNALILVLWQVKEQPMKYASFQIFQSLINASLTILFVVVLNFNWKGRITAIIITSIVFSIVSIIIIIVKYDIKFKINKSYIIHALKFGGGLIPHGIGSILILMTNRFFLTKMISIEESGMYGVANQICSIIPFFTISFNNAFVPWLYRKLTNNIYEEKVKIVKMTYVYMIVIIIISFLYLLIQPLIFKILVGENFQAAIRYSFWILLGFAFQGMYFMVCNYINYAEKTHLQALATIFVGIMNIPLNYFLISYFGSLGASISFAIAFFLLFVTTWSISAKVYPMPWKILKKTYQM